MKLNLLAITDASEYTDKVTALLNAAGLDFSCSRASTSAELQELSSLAAPDLIILDEGLKSWNKEEALRTAGATFSKTPCVIISDDLGEKGLEGVAGYLSKVPLAKIVENVSEALTSARGTVSGSAKSVPANLPAVVYFCNPDEKGGWSGVEGDIEAVTGHKKSDFLLTPLLWADRIQPEDRKTISQRLPALLATGHFECEYRWLRADGVYRWFLDKQKLEVKPDGAPLRVTGLLVDITETKRSESRLSSEKRMEAVGRLAGGLAHDFHNLLSSVLGYSTLMLGNMGAEDPLREDLNEIYKAAERAVVLTRQLLVFSKKQTFQPQLLDLNSVFSGMQTMIRQIMRDDIRGVSDLAEGLPAVKADLVQMEQVMIGLAMNVCDMTPTGGTLTVSTRAADVGAEYCKGVPGSAPGSFILLSVSGTGQAMDMESQERIFEPYSPGSGERRGATLALPAIHGIVRQHGGWITVKSEPEAGTVFEVYLPAMTVEDAPAAESGAPAVVRKIGGNGERILLVEDEEALRKFVGRVLRENGYTVFAAGSVKETLEIFRKEKGNFHLVFTDVVLPDKTGVQLAEELLTLKPTLKIIFNSGYINEKSEWPAIQQKGLKFLQKPYTIHNMLTAIKDVIKRPDL
jgi:signal transduction histidine kinase/DNA-binding response OmpR family regulator